MARKITFTTDEKTWLIHLLDNRLLVHSHSQWIPEKVIKATRNVRSKLLETVDVVYLSSYENALSTGCINEQLSAFYTDLKIKDAYDLLRMTNEQKYLAEKIDMGKDMLYKLGYDRNTRFPEYDYHVRYRNTLSAIEKIRLAEQVCISKTREQVYKIGFVTPQQEIFTWDLCHNPNIHDIDVFPKSPEQIKAIKRSFTMVTNKAGASALLTDNEARSYESLRFFKAILN
jgi:hypothetical protein